MLHFKLSTGKKIYFISDIHLGFPDEEASLEREKIVLKWMEEVKDDAAHIVFLGDVFDFWFEYRYVIPKGFSRFKAGLVKLQQAGIDLRFFTGNHDLWMFDYFPKEYSIPVYRQPTELQTGDLRLLIGHGDGLGPGDYSYKLMKKVFTNGFCQKLFRWLNPNIGMWVANKWSKSQKKQKMKLGKVLEFMGEKELIWQHCQQIAREQHAYDYYLFGHRHLPMDLPVGEKGRYLNIGDFMTHFTFAVCDGHSVELLHYPESQTKTAVAHMPNGQRQLNSYPGQL